MQENKILVRIPLKPVSINSAFQGKRFKTVACRQYCSDFMKVTRAHKKIMGYVQVEYHLYINNHSRTDWDNQIKVLQDMLVKRGYLEDDRKIYKAVVYKIPSKEDFVVVEIKSLDLEYIIKKFQAKL